MSVGVLIIAHGEIGNNLLQTASSMFGGEIPLQCQSLTVTQECEPDVLITEGNAIVESLDNGRGVLVLTDIFGSTPSNIANSLKNDLPIKVVAGVNLPMLIRILNYSNLDLTDLTEKALSGGHDGIMLCK